MVNNASDGEDGCAGSIALSGVTSITRHSANITVSFFWPDSGLEGEASLGGDSLSVIRVELSGAQAECEE